LVIPFDLCSEFKADTSALTRSRAVSAAPPSSTPPDVSALLGELNLLRTNPAGYATKLEALKGCYSSDNVFTPPGGGSPSMTHEGWAAVQEAIDDLKNMDPMSPLSRLQGLEAAASEHASYLGSGEGNYGHVGPADDRAADRIEKAGLAWEVMAGEVIGYRETVADNGPEAVVKNMVVCDGEEGRVDRKTLTHPSMTVCGIAIRSHPAVGAVTVVTLTAGFS